MRLQDDKSVPPELKAKVLAVLRAFWDALESDGAKYLLPDPAYAWRHYEDERQTLEHIRGVLQTVDDYWEQQSNLNWAQTQHGKALGITFTAGPGLNRLPDAAAVALWQALDAVYADHFASQESPTPAAPQPQPQPHDDENME